VALDLFDTDGLAGEAEIDLLAVKASVDGR